MIDPIMVKKAIKDGHLKVYWEESRPHIISVYLGDVIRKEQFVEELGDTIKLCDIRMLEGNDE